MDARTLQDIAAMPDPLERARAASAAMASLQGQGVELSRIRRAAIIELGGPACDRRTSHDTWASRRVA